MPLILQPKEHVINLISNRFVVISFVEMLPQGAKINVSVQQGAVKDKHRIGVPATQTCVPATQAGVPCVVQDALRNKDLSRQRCQWATQQPKDQV